MRSSRFVAGTGINALVSGIHFLATDWSNDDQSNNEQKKERCHEPEKFTFGAAEKKRNFHVREKSTFEILTRIPILTTSGGPSKKI